MFGSFVADAALRSSLPRTDTSLLPCHDVSSGVTTSIGARWACAGLALGLRWACARTMTMLLHLPLLFTLPSHTLTLSQLLQQRAGPRARFSSAHPPSPQRSSLALLFCALLSLASAAALTASCSVCPLSILSLPWSGDLLSFLLSHSPCLPLHVRMLLFQL